MTFVRNTFVTNSFGHILLQVNNAGSSQPKGVLNVDVEDLEQMLDVHLKGAFNITQRALPAITKSKGQW